MSVPSLLISQKSNVQIVAYMTQAAGVSFNRVLLDNSAYAPVFNTTAATTVTLTIDDSDADIAGNELLYTQPNNPSTLANFAPGPCRTLAVIQNRLFFDKSDKPGWFGYSQQYLNNVGLQFAPDLEASVPAEAGNPLAFAALDEKVIIFCREKIFVMYGTGPTPSGGFNNYSQPQDIQSDVGCIDPRSILSDAPNGIMFQSDKGLYLLGRDLSTHFIGAGVQSFFTTPGVTPPQVYAATLLADRSEARFVSRLSGGATRFLNFVYSFLTDTWSTHFGVTNQHYLMNDALWWPTARSSADGLNFDDVTAIADAPGSQTIAPFFTQAQTSWLKLSALAGFQRVREIYITASNGSGSLVASTVTLQIDFDDIDGLAAPGSYAFTFTPTAINSPTQVAVIDWRHKLRRMKCKSVSFTITDTPATAGSQPLTGIEALALELGMKKGVNRLPAGQSVG